MEKYLEAIIFIKENFSLNYSEIKNNVLKILFLEVSRKKISDIQIDLMIQTVLENINLDNNVLFHIIFNMTQKVNYEIHISNTNLLSDINEYLENDLNQFLNIFIKFGIVEILPNQIYMFWNDENVINHEKNLNNIVFSDSDFSKESINEHFSLYIKYINYLIYFSCENNNQNPNFENTIDPIFNLNKFDNGFVGYYQLNIKTNEINLFTTFHGLYKGEYNFFFNKKKLNINIEYEEDLINLFNFFKKDIVFLLKKKKLFLTYLNFFLENKLFSENVIDIFKLYFSQNEIKNILKKEYKKKIPISNNINTFQKKKPDCVHDKYFTSMIKNIYNFYEQMQEFIDKFIIFEDDIAICNICKCSIPTLIIKDIIYLNTKKYVINIDNGVLNYPPYNRFVNMYFYYEDIFYYFNFYTKFSFNVNNNFIIRLSVDNLILINNQYSILENRYKNEILENNIFFLKISNNFFKYNEKEKYPEKKNFFNLFITLLIVLIVLPLKYYNIIFFYKKRINILKKGRNVLFEDILVYFLNFLFKKFNVEYYKNIKETERLKRIRITLNIYLKIFTEETIELFKNKKKMIEDFWVNKFVKEPETKFLLNEKNYTLEDMLIYSKNKINDSYNKIIIKPALDQIIDMYIVNPKPLSDYKDNFNTVVESKYIYIDFELIDGVIDEQIQIELENDFLNIKEYILDGERFNNIEQINNDEYILHGKTQIIVKSYLDLLNLRAYNLSKKMNFFYNSDMFIYKNEIGYIEFIDILKNFIYFLSLVFKINIFENINTFFYEKKFTYSRKLLLYYQISVVNYCIEKLKLNINNYF